MKDLMFYINRRTCEILIHDCRRMEEAMEKNSLFRYEAKTFPPFSKRLPEIMIYDRLATTIARSINPFAVLNQDCLEKSIKAYEKIIPLIKNGEVKSLANHHLTSTRSNLANLEKISMVNSMNKKFNLRK